MNVTPCPLCNVHAAAKIVGRFGHDSGPFCTYVGPFWTSTRAALNMWKNYGPFWSGPFWFWAFLV